MRVIAGTAKGRRLASPPGERTRPTSDRVKEALFSSLMPELPGAAVLDLFAGSGALGIEALSRGAAHATFVERHQRTARVLDENLARTQSTDRATVVIGDVLSALASPPGAPFDIVLIDPPYGLTAEELGEVLTGLQPHLAPHAVVTVERDRRSPSPPWPARVLAERQRRYGDTVIHVGRLDAGRESPVVSTSAVIPGSFDPVHTGHLDIIGRAATRFDRVVVAVLSNPGKQPLFSVEERVELIRESITEVANVSVETFAGLLVDFCRAHDVGVICKGLRAASDFEYELQMAQMNRRMGDVETLLLPTGPEYSYLSSSLIKEIARFGGPLDGVVPETVRTRLQQRYGPETDR